MGANCTQVTVTGTGKTVKEFENGVWTNYFRVPVNAVLKTDMPGVTRLMKGAAVYTVQGSNYQFVKYNTGTGEYVGIKAPDEAAIKKLIYALPDLALGGRANSITQVDQISLQPETATWHTLLSVTIKCSYTYWYIKNNTTQEQVQEPFDLKLFRKDAQAPWHAATLLTPNAASDARRKQVLNTKPYRHEKTTLEKNYAQQALEHEQSLPTVSVPSGSDIQTFAAWFHQLLLEGNAGKTEKAFMTLIHPNQKNNAGMLSSYAADLLNKIKLATKNDFSSYKDQYCTNFQVKEKTGQSIEWWNKDRTKFSRILAEQKNGQWIITDCSIQIWQSFNPTQAQKTASSNCQ
jgi:hypothetical protein